MNLKTNVSLVLALAAALPAAAQASSSCGSAQIVSSKWDGNTYIVGAAVTCKVSSADSKGFAALNDFFLKRVQQESHVVSGPKAAKLEGMPGKVFKTLDRVESNGDQMEVNNDFYVVTDGKSRLISATFSNSVNGSGNSASVTYLDSAVDVKSSDNKAYSVKITGNIHVDKPFLVPNSFVEGPSQKAVLDAVNKSARDLAPRIDKAL
jgi:hypothetical protein